MGKHKREGHWYIEYADGFFLYRAVGMGTHSYIVRDEVVSYEVYGVGGQEPLLYPYASDRYNLDKCSYHFVPNQDMSELSLLHGGIVYMEPVDDERGVA